MSSDQYRREIAQLVKEQGKLREDIGRQEDVAGKARAEAARKRTQASKATSASSQDSYLRMAEGEDKKVAAAEKKVGELQRKLGDSMSRQQGKEQSLRSALRTEQNTADRTEDQRRRREKTETEARERAADQRRRRDKAEADARDKADRKRREIELSHARELASLQRPTVRHVIVREPEPEKVRVLYLTASPTTEGATPLRVDAEVNNVLKVLRGAKYRDRIEVQHRPAATVEDLLNGINDLRPHVVHFSGHAGGGLLFDNASMTTPGERLVGYDVVARLLAATDRRPDLIVLNACSTIEGAEDMLEAANVVIATTDSVGDASAAIFATHLYGGIAAGQTIGSSVDQARAMIAVALPDEGDVVTIRAAEGVDPSTVTLVLPG